MIIIQIFCVFLPLILTDSIVVGILISAETKEDMRLMKNTCESVEYILNDYFNSMNNLVSRIISNKAVSDFTNNSYDSPLDYYNKHYEIIRNSMFSDDRCIISIYSDAEGLVGGGLFQRMDKATGSPWYDSLVDNKSGKIVNIEYSNATWEKKRSIAFISWFDYYKSNKKEEIVKVDLKYSNVATAINNAKYSFLVYVCADNQIIFSNDGHGGLNAPFEELTDEIKANVGYSDRFSVYNKEFDVLVLRNDNVTAKAIKDNSLLLIALTLIILLFPMIFVSFLNSSMIKRLIKLSKTMDQNYENQVGVIDDIEGNDEISSLMVSYNSMAKRINTLIETEYLEKIKRQESNIARQKAELLALHSQINPHFLFNALESIRMHSVIKHENETARMVEKLALMQRQNVEWSNDLVSVRDEVRFIEAYLELQKYRFGNRLIYEINVDQECYDIEIPKISLVTFVENACIHGMENKTSSCWIFVRIAMENNCLVMEIEDTGSGMGEDAIQKLLFQMNSVTIDDLQKEGRVGILNAALRLKMFSDNKVIFEIEGEKGAGTMVTITLPTAVGQKQESESNDESITD